MATPDRGIELSPGDEFAGYRIERRLGRGGMGVLYLAIEPGLERRVALKLIAPEAAADELFARRFAEESRIAASIEHPNVVPIYAAGEADDVPWIAMRYVSGADLAKRLAGEGRLAPERAVELIAQVGNGLDAIHAAGLIHRDVKPANVLLSGDGEDAHAYITDFGVARNVATESGLTQTGRFVGTLDYVAPEQISGDAIDARVDVYALGCLLYKLLTGQVPFPREGEPAKLFAHLNDPPPAASLTAPEVPMALDDVVIRAMSKQPDDRYLSAGDLGRAAQAALGGEAPTVPERTVATGAAATRTAETRRIGIEGRRRVGRWLAGALLAMIVLGAATVLLVSGGGSDSNPTPKAKAVPTTLSRSELIAKADAICAKSRADYKNVFSAESEEAPDVTYALALVGISTRAVNRFRALDAPPGVEPAFAEYVEAQERVKRYDAEALEAAQEEDATAYAEARDARDAEAAERFDLARRIGLAECSTNSG